MRDHYKQKYEWLFNAKRAIFHLWFFLWVHVFCTRKTIWTGFSSISWRSVLLVEKTGGPGENHQPEASHWQTLSHNPIMIMLYRVHLSMSWIHRYMCHWTRTHMLYNEKNCGWQIMAKNFNLNSWLCSDYSQLIMTHNWWRVISTWSAMGYLSTNNDS